MGADAVDGIAGGEITLRDDGGKGPRRMKAFDYILTSIICTEPHIRLAKVKPNLLRFILHPIIKELIGKSNAPAQPTVDNSPNLDI